MGPEACRTTGNSYTRTARAAAHSDPQSLEAMPAVPIILADAVTGIIEKLKSNLSAAINTSARPVQIALTQAIESLSEAGSQLAMVQDGKGFTLRGKEPVEVPLSRDQRTDALRRAVYGLVPALSSTLIAQCAPEATGELKETVEKHRSALEQLGVFLP